MPGSWPEGLGDDHGDDADDEARFSPPVHPDDRLWRHPSELSWSSAAAAPPPGDDGAGTRSGPKLWALAITSGLTGAALAVGMVAVFVGIGGDTDRVVERVGVRDQLANPFGTDASADLVALAGDVIPSVVRIEVERLDGETVGSGIVVLDDGHILTNAHVLAGAQAITIVLADGTAVAGRLVGTDPETDIAVVAPDGDEASAVTWVPAVRGDGSDLEVGEPAIAVGSVLASRGAPSVTVGVVSGTGRRITTVEGLVLHGMIQTDAPITEGSSGGALCDRMGRVVGVTTSHGADSPNGVGFATPMAAAWATAEALIADGTVHRVWLGIEGADLDATRSSVLGISGSSGAVVVDRVIDGSPAALAGLADGDVVMSVDGRRVTSMSELVLALRGYRPGDAIRVEVRRGDDTETMTVTLVERAG